MASQDLFHPHLPWFCAFVLDSLVRVFKLLNVCLAELTGSLGLTFTSSKPSWKDVYGEKAKQQLIIPASLLSSDLLLSQRITACSILNAFCASEGGKDSIRGWPD